MEEASSPDEELQMRSEPQSPQSPLSPRSTSNSSEEYVPQGRNSEPDDSSPARTRSMSNPDVRLGSASSSVDIEVNQFQRGTTLRRPVTPKTNRLNRNQRNDEDDDEAQAAQQNAANVH